MTDDGFPRIVSLACHDLRTPLATVYGFARTLSRAGELDERSARFVGMIEEASEQMTGLLDELGTAARIVGGRWEPALRQVDTMELARTDDERVVVEGRGTTIETEADSVARSLRALATAAIRFGPAAEVRWQVEARELRLSPITADAAPVVTGADVRDLGSVVARLVVEELGGGLELEGETLVVRL
jgi:signal transduction histidine kinase